MAERRGSHHRHRNLVKRVEARYGREYDSASWVGAKMAKLALVTMCFALGFSDAAYFTHVFRRWTKTTRRGFRPLERRDGVAERLP
jgi:AraC-like DNA-binding protein